VSNTNNNINKRNKLGCTMRVRSFRSTSDFRCASVKRQEHHLIWKSWIMAMNSVVQNTYCSFGILVGALMYKVPMISMFHYHYHCISNIYKEDDRRYWSWSWPFRSYHNMICNIYIFCTVLKIVWYMILCTNIYIKRSSRVSPVLSSKDCLIQDRVMCLLSSVLKID
jgi:hypothetical protein